MALPLILAFAFFFFFSVPNTTSDAKIVTTLPGYNGNLSFHLETGYVAVGEKKDVQYFYYFAGSEKKGSEDPLLMWISGGPGCSSAAAFFFEHGPLNFVIEHDYDGTIPPQLGLNEYRWTQLGLNILYVDAPFGTGFSYATRTPPPPNDDIHLVAHAYDFIQEWLKSHPSFSKSELYVGGDGYSGKPVAAVVHKILEGNGVGSDQPINLKGYVIGNPGTDTDIDGNAQFPFAHRQGMIPDGLYESAWKNCDDGNFNTATSEACLEDSSAIKDLIMPNLNWMHIKEPACSDVTNDPFPPQTYIQLPTSDPIQTHSDRAYLEEIKEPMVVPHIRCRNYGHKFLATWANDAEVQAALGVPARAGSNWQYCTPQGTIDNNNIKSVVHYHKHFSAYSTLRALLYSGDQDISIPYIGTQKWIDSLNLTETQEWRAWSYEKNETGGYTRSFNKNNYDMTYVLVKGGGHYAAETSVKECHYMISRWLAYSDL